MSELTTLLTQYLNANQVQDRDKQREIYEAIKNLHNAEVLKVLDEIDDANTTTAKDIWGDAEDAAKEFVASKGINPDSDTPISHGKKVSEKINELRTRYTGGEPVDLLQKERDRMVKQYRKEYGLPDEELPTSNTE